ncbi:amino acid adenylation domain-containing protein [Streptomyces sp. NPDC001262]|uniref:non-ribosomal peptide synthetase n=1 Tax=Streptomyces sp. NPDC001262 TaxID=3364552 RepID=UPI00367712D9
MTAAEPLSPEEQQRILVDWNRTASGLPHGTPLHEHFAARAAAAPDAVAMVQGEHRLTYGELDGNSADLAERLRALGVRRGSRVALALPRGPEFLTAVLAVLRAGAAYVPVDVDYPADRINFILEDANCEAVISDEGASAPRRGAGNCASNHTEPAGPDDLAYVIYTSGSTGRPKGIAVRHRGAVNNLLDLAERFRIAPGDKVLHLSSTSFDMSVVELLGTVLAGATVVTPNPDGLRDPAHWHALAVEHGVTVWNTTPGLLGAYLGHLENATPGATLPPLRLAMLGGDRVPPTLPRRAARVLPAMRLANLGGFTEASVHSTVQLVDPQHDPSGDVPIGRPLANQRIYILDEAMQPVRPGVTGELYVAGTGLAEGYLGREELTRERFLQWSYGPVRDERVYRTGDLARYRADGTIEFLGRSDFQVKVNGVRIEPGEIEAALRRQPGVREAVVVAREDAAGDRALVGYLEAADGTGTVDTTAVREALTRVLPGHHVPSALVVLDRLPLSPNGKLDRAALPAPTPPAEPDGAGEAPADSVEQRVADVFAELLGADAFARDDDFFALGGTSWKAMRAVQTLGEGLRLADLFRNPTPRRLAEVLRAG